MATRRTRIKGIANIPQRRKVENKPVLPESVPSSKPAIDDEDNSIVEAAVTLPAVDDTIKDAGCKSIDALPKQVISINDTSTKTQISSDDLTEDSSVVQNSEGASYKENELSSAQENMQNFVDVSRKEIEPNTQGKIATDSEKPQLKPATDPSDTIKSVVPVPRRRNFIKPTINAKILSQRPKLKLDPIKLEESEMEINTVPEPAVQTAKLVIPQKVSQNENLRPPSPDQIHPNRNIVITNVLGVKSSSDNEYSAEPLSPTKLLNRSRIKAVPRLGHRRTSITIHGSASESEDDSKKHYKRIRTESACSAVSIGNEPQNKIDLGSPQKNKEFSTIIQRKCKRTEQSRKMAEARRHFIHKFGNKTPDKQKLTMIDLIFYNPVTNPMSQKPKKLQLKSAKEETPPKSPEKEDDPDDIHSDEENAVPAPQIKIGADGEIVIDEKSLVIENTQTKKDREELQKSELVDGDFDTSYGVYKRQKRSKDWSKEETLRFYKALNTLGTDFTLMTQLFEGRSRRELKMKFKKEERVNRLLVDKALTQPIEFNIKELQEEVENEKKKAEQERALKAKRAEEWALNKKNGILPYTYSGIKKKVKTSKVSRKSRKTQDQDLNKFEVVVRNVGKGAARLWQESDDEADTEKQSVHKILKPTRFGRIPKPTKTFNSTTIHHRSLQQQSQVAPDNMENPNALKPGSLMILYSQTPTGEPAFKVFMVTQNQNKVPLILGPEELNNLRESVAVDLPPENNYTIVHNEVEETILPDDSTSQENVILPDAVEQQMCPYEQSNLTIPDENDITLPEENVSLCTDGKYDVNLTNESECNNILGI